jgi:hypothetical protein
MCVCVCGRGLYVDRGERVAIALIQAEAHFELSRGGFTQSGCHNITQTKLKEG